MTTEISEGLKISVETEYQEGHSDPDNMYYLYTYKITIENQNPYSVKLLSRRWEIFDSLGSTRLVEGEGVVGQQPELNPGGRHTYTSSCDLVSDYGIMKGSYIFKRLDIDTYFDVTVPEFELWLPFRKN